MNADNDGPLKPTLPEGGALGWADFESLSSMLKDAKLRWAQSSREVTAADEAERNLSELMSSAERHNYLFPHKGIDTKVKKMLSQELESVRSARAAAQVRGIIRQQVWRVEVAE